MLELTEQKANDMNDIVSKTLEQNQPHSDGFELFWYLKFKPDLNEDYMYHLHSLMEYYNGKYGRNWITLGDRGYVSANNNTSYFYHEGGYKKIFEMETMDQNIKKLTEKQLQKSIWQIKGWWIFVLVNAAISLLITWLLK